MIRLAAFFLFVTAMMASAAAGETLSDGWISHPAATAGAAPIVLHFRRRVSLGVVPRSFPVRITADNRFVFYVNGARVAAGPSTGDAGHWRYGTVDLAPYLKPGPNILAAVVWNGVKPAIVLPPTASPTQKQAAAFAELFRQLAPLFQQSVATGFRLEGSGDAADISTRNGGWRVKVDAGHTMTNGYAQFVRYFYVAGAPETIDAARSDWTWTLADERGGG